LFPEEKKRENTEMSYFDDHRVDVEAEERERQQHGQQEALRAMLMQRMMATGQMTALSEGGLKCGCSWK